MKTTDIRYSWQVLALLLHETGCGHLNSTPHTPVISKSAPLIDRETEEPFYRDVSTGISNFNLNRSGEINKVSRIGSFENYFVPRKEDSRLVFTCEMPNSKITATFNTRYKPHLTMSFTPNSVYEGQSVTLCCCSDSMPSTIDLWWEMKSAVLYEKKDTNVLCHEIINISRHDSGVYRCFAENELGILSADVMIKVICPPYIPDQHINKTEEDVSRILQCVAYGVPAKYTYGQWTHLSFFGEHIRYLKSSTDGKVILPRIANKTNRYQDSGIYICAASNTVPDSTGNRFQNGKIFVISNGPPVFVEKIENRQYGDIGNIFNLKFIVYTKSEIEWCNVQSDNKDIAASMEKKSLNGTIIFHGTEIIVEAIQVVLSFKLSKNNNSYVYTVTLGNGYGNNSFELEIELVTAEEKIINGTKVASITILVILVMCVLVLVAAVFLQRKRKRNRERRIVDIPELVEGQPVPVENIVYQDAIALEPRTLQANGEVIEYNYETNSHEQNMRPLTGQLNNSDVYFQPSTSQDVRIRGIEKRTVYSEVLNSERGSSVIETRSVSSSDEEDFVDIGGLENFIDRSED